MQILLYTTKIIVAAAFDIDIKNRFDEVIDFLMKVAGKA